MRPNHSLDDLTALIHDWQKGDRLAFDKAFALLYDQIHAEASSRLSRCDRWADWQTTVLVQESYLSLVEKHGIVLKNRSHFLHLVGLVMHRLLVDSARKRQAIVHGGDMNREIVELDMSFKVGSPLVALAVDEVIVKLAKIDNDLAMIVKLRCFAGFSNREVADILKMTLPTYNRRWKVAKGILLHCLPNESL